MLNRRNILKSGFALPLFPPLNLHGRKSRLEKIADDIEQNAIKILSARNPIIQSIKLVEIYNDKALTKFREKSSFYGFVEVKLYPINYHIFEDCKVDVSSTGYKNIVDLVNDCRHDEYAFQHDLDVLLTQEETNQVLDILWKRAGYKGYKII